MFLRRCTMGSQDGSHDSAIDLVNASVADVAVMSS
eukprot:CAMPEP_0178676918 /NCGR_PEP_ID=MMETSP0698-20121128/36172_1 /TAXON_ID=265572 /ORGANISM="Extubocellulus spinifer, Strain CCMP396" /LENGTH=34 /DNA_ID= /DNA_START= /DNA_END= /DNA_ORIENTATION=